MRGRTNSLIDLYRLVAAIGILFYHGFSIKYIPFFSHANLFVDFFFVLTGFFFGRNIERYRDRTVARSLGGHLWSRLKKMGIPLLIGYICNVVYSIAHPDGIKILHYLWFIHMMLIVELVILAMYKILKSNKKRMLIGCAVIFVGASVMYSLKQFAGLDAMRAVCYLPLGVLLGAIPSIKSLEKSKMAGVITALLAIVFAVMFVIAREHSWVIRVIATLIFPLLIYFTMHVDAHIKAFTNFSRLSLWLYIYQSVPYMLRGFNISSGVLDLAIIIGFVAVTEAIYLILDFKKGKYKPHVEREKVALNT